MNVAVTLKPVRVILKAQVRAAPTVRVTPPVQLTVRSETRVTPLTVRVGGPYVLNTTPSAATSAIRFEQETPSTLWVIPNPWGVRAASILTMVDDEVVTTTILENTAAQVALRFPTPRAGLALLTKGA